MSIHKLFMDRPAAQVDAETVMSFRLLHGEQKMLFLDWIRLSYIGDTA